MAERSPAGAIRSSLEGFGYLPALPRSTPGWLSVGGRNGDTPRKTPRRRPRPGVLVELSEYAEKTREQRAASAATPRPGDLLVQLSEYVEKTREQRAASAATATEPPPGAALGRMYAEKS